MTWKAPHYDDLFPLARPFSVYGVVIPIPSQSIALHLLIPIEAPLIQSQETLMRFPHIAFLDLTMTWTGICKIPPKPQHLLMIMLYFEYILGFIWYIGNIMTYYGIPLCY